MNEKLVITLVIAINSWYSICGAALRRTPKVYNALITTDENLTSSRAFPVIQPTIHEGAATHYPFGPYSPYGFYSPPVVRFGQPIVPGFGAKSPLGYPLPQGQFPPQFLGQQPGGAPNYFAGLPPHFGPPSGPGVLPPQMPQESAPQPDMRAPPQPNEPPQPMAPPPPPPQPQPSPTAPGFTPSNPENVPNEKLPIPLNEFGLPPSLISLSQLPNRRNPSGLPPFPYQQFPLQYDGFGGYREQYLPPFGFYPQQQFPFGRGSPPKPYPMPQMPQQMPSPAFTTLSPTPPAEVDDVTDSNDIFISTEPSPYTTEANFDHIKNGSKSKDKKVPDVPPPPIPSGAKSKQS